MLNPLDEKMFGAYAVWYPLHSIDDDNTHVHRRYVWGGAWVEIRREGEGEERGERREERRGKSEEKDNMGLGE